MTSSLHIVCPACGATNRVPTARLADRPRCGQCRRALFTGQPADLDETGFRRMLSKNDLPLLIDFWAPWCGPCLSMAPQFAAACADLEPQVRCAKVDTEALPSLAARYDIRSIPTLVLFRGGRETARQSGAMTATQLLAWVRMAL